MPIEPLTCRGEAIPPAVYQDVRDSAIRELHRRKAESNLCQKRLSSRHVVAIVQFVSLRRRLPSIFSHLVGDVLTHISKALPPRHQLKLQRQGMPLPLTL